MAPPHITVFDNQFKNNIAVAQRYIYDYSSTTSVIVGSSMSATLRNEKLLKNQIYNLAFRGSGVMTGLHLIKNINSTPSLVLVEINSVLSSSNNDFLKEVLSPIKFRLNRVFPCLRDEYQPINVLINILLNVSDRNIALNTFNQRRFDRAFENHRKKYVKPHDLETLEKRIIAFGIIVNNLINNGVKVVLFEMPIHEDLRTSTSMIMLRSEIHRRFPKDKYSWINGLTISANETSDGIHLTTKAASVVTEQLIEKIKSSFQDNLD